jgi:hypothetical protein
VCSSCACVMYVMPCVSFAMPCVSFALRRRLRLGCLWRRACRALRKPRAQRRRARRRRRRRQGLLRTARHTSKACVRGCALQRPGRAACLPAVPHPRRLDSLFGTLSLFLRICACVLSVGMVRVVPGGLCRALLARACVKYAAACARRGCSCSAQGRHAGCAVVGRPGGRGRCWQ